MSLHTNHKLLVSFAFFGFLLITIGVAIVPAQKMKRISEQMPPAPLEGSSELGRQIYVQEGCTYCHTQFVRDLPMDAPFGRGSVIADYAGEAPPLIGTQRTGPDLANVGRRQPSDVWHLLHLYNPRATVPASVMPGYPWYFVEKEAAEPGDIVVPVPADFLNNPAAVLVARPEAIALTEYLLSLKQSEVTP
jgi:cytochrome c oxidase cbb3-type subunit 2